MNTSKFVVVIVRCCCCSYRLKVTTGVQEMKVESQKVSPRRVIVKAELYTHTSIKLGPTVPWPHTWGLHHTGWEYKTPVWWLLWDFPMKGLQPSWFHCSPGGWSALPFLVPDQLRKPHYGGGHMSRTRVTCNHNPPTQLCKVNFTSGLGFGYSLLWL